MNIPKPLRFVVDLKDRFKDIECFIYVLFYTDCSHGYRIWRHVGLQYHSAAKSEKQTSQIVKLCGHDDVVSHIICIVSALQLLTPTLPRSGSHKNRLKWTYFTHFLITHVKSNVIAKVTGKSVKKLTRLGTLV